MGAVAKLKNARSREEWAGAIATAWNKQVDGIFETGMLLESAKSELPHGEWLKLIEAELPFTRTTASRLVQISEDGRLRNDAHVHHLPVAWGTLYELTKLDEETFTNGIEKGLIHPKMERKDVKALLPPPEPRAKPAKTRDPADSIPRGKEFASWHATEVYQSVSILVKKFTPEEKAEFFAQLKFSLEHIEKTDEGE